MLEVKDLKVSFRSEQGLMRAIDGVSFNVAEGEILGMVGESGSGARPTPAFRVSCRRLPN